MISRLSDFSKVCLSYAVISSPFKGVWPSNRVLAVTLKWKSFSHLGNGVIISVPLNYYSKAAAAAKADPALQVELPDLVNFVTRFSGICKESSDKTYQI